MYVNQTMFEMQTSFAQCRPAGIDSQHGRMPLAAADRNRFHLTFRWILST